MVQTVKNHFYDSMRPIFIFSTILGVFPMLPLRTSGKTELYTSKKLNLITLSFLTVYSASFLFTILQKSNNVVGGKFYQKQNAVSNFGLTLQFIFGITIVYTIYLMSLVHTENARGVMGSLRKVDEGFAGIDREIRYRNNVWYQIVIISSGLMMIALIASMQVVNITIEKFPPLSWAMWILFVYPGLLLFNLNSQYGITVVLIYQRFRMINEELEKIKIQLGVSQINALTILKNLNALITIYEILCRTAKRTNANYNIQMLPSLMHQFFMSLYPIFYFYWMYSTKPFSASCWLAWSFFKIYEILHVAISCHLASQEAEIVGRKIHKALIGCKDERVEEKLVMFSQQVVHGNFKFTLCGLFNIDAGLVFNMIGSSTTFIVIMIQFQETITPNTCISNINRSSI